MSSPIKSKTHQNVTIGAVVVGGVLAWVISLLRANAPSLVTWSVGTDATIVGLGVGIFGPFVSRWLAFLRDPIKREDKTKEQQVVDGRLPEDMSYVHRLPPHARTGYVRPSGAWPDPPDDE